MPARFIRSGWIVGALQAGLAVSSAFAATNSGRPDFSPDPGTGWISFGPEYMPVAGKPRPVAADPAHPFVPNAIENSQWTAKREGFRESHVPGVRHCQPNSSALGSRTACQMKSAGPVGSPVLF